MTAAARSNRVPRLAGPACAAALLAAAALAASGARGADEGGRYALLVGVEKYDPKFLTPLQYAEDDMLAVAASLGRLGFNVVTMTSDAEIPGRRPMLADDIMAQVERRLKNRDPADTVVLAFSGHGVQLKGDAAADADRETFFCPERARLDDPATLLPLSQVLEKLRACAARQKLLLVDACRVEVEPKAIRDKSGVPTIELDAAAPLRRKIPEGMVALFSCGPRQKSYELGELGHSVFTHYVVEYLESRADPSRYSRQRPTVQELASYVSRQTRDLVEQRLDDDQEPEMVLPSGRFVDWSLGTLGSLASLDRPAPVDRPLPAVPAVPRPAAGARPGAVVENSLGMQLVAIPAGEFSMGSGETKEQLKAAGFGFVTYDKFDCTDESPVHRVRITKAFLMGVREVTLGEFLAFYNDGYQGKLDCEQDGKGGCGYDPAKAALPFAEKPEYRPWSWGHPDMDFSTDAAKKRAFRHPVVNVSWNDCVAFCAWLSRKEGKKYRLPTEAEWEYACRAATTTRFWNGDDPEGLAAIGNVADATLKEKFSGWDTIRARDGHVFTAPVGSYPANPFGLHDMHGNVNEWCSDWYDEKYYETSPAADPQGPVSAGSFRVIRGGGWLNTPVNCRSANRVFDPPTYRVSLVGFRVVRELE